MKKYWLVVVLFISFYAEAQNRTNVWFIGNDSYPLNRVGIDFSSGFANVYEIYSLMPLLTTNASICDTSGALLFYTNGIYIANKQNDTLTNSKDFNPGTVTDMFAYYGNNLAQGCMFLPIPDSDSLFWIFNVTGEFFEAHGGLDVQPLHLSCSLIDASLSNGLGGIVDGYKNIHCIDDTISQGRLTACKHANGRDWWVVTHKYFSDVFYTLLVAPDSIYGPFEQSIGSVYTSNDIWGMAVFSPDGTKYVTINHLDTIEVYDFDRCSGQFSNPVQVVINDSALTLGGAISASSRFLYVNTYTGIYQIDLTSVDLQSSIIQVAVWDSIDDPFNTYFFLEQLAPDNKIYVSTYNSCYSLHVINSPDSLGLLCNVVQRGLELPDSNSNFSVPNHPNYDLGPLQGSPCDTLYQSSHSISPPNTFRIYPNPTADWLNIIYNSNEDALFELYDVFGQRVATMSLFHYFKNRLLDVSHLASGTYFATVKQNGVKTWSEKVVVAK